MKFLKYFLLATLIHGYPSCSMGQTVDRTIEANYAWGLDSETNLVKNPSAAKNRQYALAVGITLTRDTSAGNKIDNKASWSIDATAINDYQEFELIPTPDDLTSGNCGFSGIFKGDGRLYKAQILDGSSVVLAQTVALTNETGWRYFKVWHPCGASGARKVRITQTEAGTAPAINVGKLFYGRMEPGAEVPPNTFSAKVSSAGVLSDIVNPQYFNGTTFAPTDTSLFGILFKGLSSAPNCNVTPQSSSLTEQYAAVKATAETTSGVNIRTSYNNTTSSFTKFAVGFTITCTKTGSDYIQPAITPDQTDKPYTSFTPVLSTGALATGGNQKYWYMLDGPNMIMYFEYEPGANVGTAGSGAYLITVPGGYSISSTITSGTGNATNFGFVYFLKSTNNGDARAAQITLVNQTQLAIRILNPTTNTYETWNNTTAPLSTANMRIGFIATIPIAGRENIRSSNAPLLLNTVYADTAVKAEKAAGLTSVDYGTANVTFTAGANVAAITATQTCQYIRVGSVVEATCPITATCSAGVGNLTVATFTLPIATTQGSTIKGTFGTIVPTPEQGWVTNSSNNGSVAWRCGSTSSETRHLKFSYLVP